MDTSDFGSDTDRDPRGVNERNNEWVGLGGPSLMTKDLYPTNDRGGAIIL